LKNHADFSNAPPQPDLYAIPSKRQTNETIDKIARTVETAVQENFADADGYNVPVTVAVNYAQAV
jgi:hypothetical protein